MVSALVSSFFVSSSVSFSSFWKAYKNADGTFTGIIELGTSEGTLGTYKLTFKADDGENALCPYDVTDAALVK